MIVANEDSQYSFARFTQPFYIVNSLLITHFNRNISSLSSCILLTLNKWKVSFTLDPSATVMLQVQLLNESYSSGKFFVVKTPDSPLNSATHCAERIGTYLVFTSTYENVN